MLRKIKVYGKLAEFIGYKEFEAEVNNTAQAVRFLISNFKGIEKHMADQLYTIQVGARVVTEDLFNFRSQEDIKIIPVVHGNFVGLLLGVGAILGGSAVSGITTAFIGQQLIATALTTIGTSMVIDGVTSMLTPQQEPVSAVSQQSSLDPSALASNYSFTGLTNISNAGIPVNLVYGEILVGSIVVSNGVDTVQVEGNN